MTDFKSRYTGPQIDEAVSIALSLDQMNNGWIRIPSSDKFPINLNDLINPGNFTIGYFLNGSELMNKTKPVNISIMEIDGIIVHYSLVWDQIEYRKKVDGEWTRWTSTKSSGYIYQQPDPPLSPEEGSLWIDTTLDDSEDASHPFKVYINAKWVNIGPKDMMSVDIYDPNGKGMDIYLEIDRIINEFIEDNNLRSLEEDMYGHINNTDIHTSLEEKEGWNNKETPESATQKINDALNSSKNYTDMSIENAMDSMGNIEEDLANFDSEFKDHENNEEIHVSEEDRISWDSKADGNHIHMNDGRVKIDASDVITGIISLDRIPHGALEHIIEVDILEDMFLLTKEDAQNGDSIYVIDSEEFYYVVDDTKLDTDDGYKLYSSGIASSVLWGNIKNKPDTIRGYDITDAYDKIEVDDKIDIVKNDLIDYVNSEISKISTIDMVYKITDGEDLGSGKINGIYHLNDNYIAIGEGAISKSVDGVIWDTVSLDIDDNVNDIIYDGDKYILVGESGKLLTSTDLVIWTDSSMDSNENLNGIESSGSKYIAIGDGGYLSHSDNLENWDSISLPTTNDLNDIIYSAGIFIAVGTGGTILTSADGEVWETIANPLSSIRYYNRDKNDGGLLYDDIIDDISLTKIKHINNSYIILTSHGQILSTPNLESWTVIDLGVNVALRDIIYHDGKYVIVGDSGTILLSPNLIDWNPVRYERKDNLTGIIYGNDGFIIVGSNGNIMSAVLKAVTLIDALTDLTENAEDLTKKVNELYSNELELWRRLKIDLPADDSNVRKIVYGLNRYMWASDKGVIYSSVDGVIWTNVYNPTNEIMGLKIHLVNNHLIAIGGGGVLLTSLDGITWIRRDIEIDTDLHDVIYGNNLYGVVGSDMTILTSTDLIAWTRQTEGLSDDVTLYSIIYVDDQYVVVGSKGTVLTSSDAISWTPNSGIETINALHTIIYNDGLYVAWGNGVISSPDAITWSEEVANIYDIIYCEGRYIGILVNDEVETLVESTDAITWSELMSFDNERDNHNTDLTYMNGVYIVAFSNGSMYMGEDPTDLSRRSIIPVREEWIDLSICNDNLFVTGYSNGQYVILETEKNNAKLLRRAIGASYENEGMILDIVSNVDTLTEKIKDSVDILDGIEKLVQ